MKYITVLLSALMGIMLSAAVSCEPAMGQLILMNGGH